MNRNDQQFAAQRIREQYVEKQTTELDRLRALDIKVKRPAATLAYVLGSVGAIIMGAGMSLVMTDIGELLGMTTTMFPGIVVGIVGLAVALVNYPIYKRMLAARKKKYGAEILELSEKIMNR